MKRSKHGLSHYVLSTFDMGQLIPVGHFEVLPGDSVRLGTSALLRVSPLMTPVMHPCIVRLHHWFVPYRIIWDEWENFITGGTDGMGDGAVIPTFPGGAVIGRLSDYFGIPQDINPATLVNQFPFRAYNKIWNEFYRDQDLQAEVPETEASVQPIAWEKDYFTSARPWTQKGPEVTLPIGATAPVVPAGGGQGFPTFYDGNTSLSLGSLRNADPGVEGVGVQSNAGGGGGLFWTTPGLVADLSQATSSTVNDVRRAFAIQRYQEARAQYGSRYTEYLRYLGIASSDARLQRPEYLGGGRTTISFSEVLRTGNESAASTAPIGEMSGHGIAAVRTRRTVRFFEEHGIVMTLASIRPRTMYASQLHRSWRRATKEDFWQRELEQIGQQPVSNSEVYAAATLPNDTFGFQNRYDEYRHMQSYVTGDFRTTMNDWHLAREFAAQPVLNASFVECDPSKRIHAEQTADVIWGMFSHSIQMRRLVGHKTIGRLF